MTRRRSSRPAKAVAGNRGTDHRLIVGDCIEAMLSMEAGSVDAVVCDPPYAIGWRGERWDSGAIYEAARERSGPGLSKGEAFETWCGLWGAECLRLMKPGAHLLAFGSPRTYHRLTSGLEDAGLEVRDTLMWIYGTGMRPRRYPGGRSTRLKPAFEPILLARKPPERSITEAIATLGTGGLQTDACRVEGRHPANLIASHESGCQGSACAPGCAAALLDADADAHRGSRGQTPPSRFLYCPKPRRSEREAGCEELPVVDLDFFPNAGRRAANSSTRNPHPTLKPITLMRWLVRLVGPEGGLVLDPFAGSGTTGIAAVLENRAFCGIEADPRHAEVARARIAHWARGGADVD